MAQDGTDALLRLQRLALRSVMAALEKELEDLVVEPGAVAVRLYAALEEEGHESEIERVAGEIAKLRTVQCGECRGGAGRVRYSGGPAEPAGEKSRRRERSRGRRVSSRNLAAGRL